jgi:protein associated with RNAse G/E
MNNIKIGDILKIQCYKHNGQVYRNWDETLVLEVNDDYIVCANNKAKVTEIDGRSWMTKEPAILFYYKKKWFNIIAQFKKNGIYYYCNVASPYLIDDSTIKYIDYDLDLRVFPDGSFRVLDRGEYDYHKVKMKYGTKIDKIVNTELNNLISDYLQKKGPFEDEYLKVYYNMYINMSKMYGRSHKKSQFEKK